MGYDGKTPGRRGSPHFWQVNNASDEGPSLEDLSLCTAQGWMKSQGFGVLHFFNKKQANSERE